MTTAKLKENYEKHLEANWTREGRRSFLAMLPTLAKRDETCINCGNSSIDHPSSLGHELYTEADYNEEVQRALADGLFELPDYIQSNAN